MTTISNSSQFTKVVFIHANIIQCLLDSLLLVCATYRVNRRPAKLGIVQNWRELSHSAISCPNCPEISLNWLNFWLVIVSLKPSLHWLSRFVSYMNYGSCSFFKLCTAVPRIKSMVRRSAGCSPCSGVLWAGKHPACKKWTLLQVLEKVGKEIPVDYCCPMSCKQSLHEILNGGVVIKFLRELPSFISSCPVLYRVLWAIQRRITITCMSNRNGIYLKMIQGGLTAFGSERTFLWY